MYEFLENNSMYVVLIVVLIIWTGISFFLFYTENKINKLEKKVDELKIKEGSHE
jgi:CcmD family protein